MVAVLLLLPRSGSEAWNGRVAFSFAFEFEYRMQIRRRCNGTDHESNDASERGSGGGDAGEIDFSELLCVESALEWRR